MQISFINANSSFYSKSLQKTKSPNVSFGELDPILQAVNADTQEIKNTVAGYSIKNTSSSMEYPFKMAKDLPNILKDCDDIIQKRKGSYNNKKDYGNYLSQLNAKMSNLAHGNDRIKGTVDFPLSQGIMTFVFTHTNNLCIQLAGE
jgi:hypothetical protein